MTWLCVAVLLMWMRADRYMAMVNALDPIECTAKEFQEKLNSGKTLFVYFGHEGELLRLFFIWNLRDIFDQRRGAQYISVYIWNQCVGFCVKKKTVSGIFSLVPSVTLFVQLQSKLRNTCLDTTLSKL